MHALAPSVYQDQLPPTLYLQMDNCARENKNKIVLTFGALLVELGVFRKVGATSLLFRYSEYGNYN